MIAKVASAVVAIGLSFGLNLLLRPEFDTHYAPSDYAQPAGSLTLTHRGTTLEIPLMATHIVTADVVRFGRRYQLRELTLRAATSGDGWPRMELFVGLGQGGGDLLGGTRDPSVLAQRELPLARTGRLGARPSYVVLSGTERSDVISGSLWVSDVRQNSGDVQAEGRVELQVQTETGVSMVTGKWNGSLVWDAPTET